ncbi:MAG TPA: rhodanese-like domain-containing protein [Candidatus Acidoferrales bacterium]|nr:rhodanese-like domain-containing protein [Candidatus Acidoferrales bacterium]
MTNAAKWFAAGCLAFALFLCLPKVASAQDDSTSGFDDPTEMAVPPAQFITPADMKKLMDNKDTSFALVDTQPEEAFAEGHIPGAINYPWVQRVKPPIPLPRNKMLVLYCPCNHDEDSLDMYKKLAEFGYLNVKILEGGWYKWVALRYPVDGTDAADAIKMADAAAANGSSVAASSAGAAATQPAAQPAAATAGPITSGRQVGAVTPSFRVIDVTGKYKGQDTCYVCEYGTAPTVIGFFQKPSPEAADLIVKLNALVESQKNLKGFAVMIAGPDTKAWLEKLAADKGLQIPLVYLQRGPQDLGVRLYRINTQADNTFLVDDNRQVVSNLVNVTDDTFQKVADASSKMLAAARPGNGGQ